MSVLRPLLLLLLLLLAQPGTAGDKLQNCFDSTLRGKTVDVRLRAVPKTGTTMTHVFLQHLLAFAAANCEATSGSTSRIVNAAQQTAIDLSKIRVNKHHLTDADQASAFLPANTCNRVWNHVDTASKRSKCYEHLVASNWTAATCPTLKKPNALPRERTIILMRDPRGLLSSWCHFQDRRGCNDTYLHKYIKCTTMNVALSYHWWTAMTPVGTIANQVVLFYEDLVNRPNQTYEAMARFVGFSAEVAPQAAEHARKVAAFDNMKKLEQAHRLPQLPNIDNKVFRGTARGFEEDFSPPAVTQAWLVMKEMLPPDLLSRFQP